MTLDDKKGDKKIRSTLTCWDSIMILLLIFSLFQLLVKMFDENRTQIEGSRSADLWGQKWPRRQPTLLQPVWPDRAIYWTLGYFLKPMATIDLPKSPPFLSNFLKVSKSVIILVKSFLGNFYRHLAILFRSHWLQSVCAAVHASQIYCRTLKCHYGAEIFANPST